MEGHRTAYLWEEVWERHSWLEILGRYCIAERDKTKQIRRLVFPRYHQLAVTRLLLQAVLEEGPGWRYLIQHSAGSGKTASIGWSSHLLASLHDEHDPVIADEAHSSQTGDAALKLRQVLSAAELADLADGGEVSIDDLLAAAMSTRASGTRASGTRAAGARAGNAGITYVAFTATPKAKTLELFGRRPNPNEPAGPGNLPLPFH